MLRRRRVVLCGVLLPLTVTFFVFQAQRISKPAAEEAPVGGVQGDEMLRVVHLDLKGAPPKMRVLRTLFPLIAAAGANALLLEYEDMFPFEGMLQNASAKNAYSREEVRCCDNSAVSNAAVPIDVTILIAVADPPDAGLRSQVRP
jgi:hypothetical protein